MPVITRSQLKKIKQGSQYKYFYMADESYECNVDYFYEITNVDFSQIQIEDVFKPVLKVVQYIPDQLLLNRLTEDTNTLYEDWISSKSSMKENLLTSADLNNVIGLMSHHVQMTITFDDRNERIYYLETKCIPMIIKFSFLFDYFHTSAFLKLHKVLSAKMFLFIVESGVVGAFLLFALLNPQLVTDKCFPILNKNQSITSVHDIPEYKDLIIKHLQKKIKLKK